MAIKFLIKARLEKKTWKYVLIDASTDEQLFKGSFNEVYAKKKELLNYKETNRNVQCGDA